MPTTNQTAGTPPCQRPWYTLSIREIRGELESAGWKVSEVGNACPYWAVTAKRGTTKLQGKAFERLSAWAQVAKLAREIEASDA